MTRDEFIDDVVDFYDLRNFCYDYDCDELDDVYDSRGLDGYINNSLIDWAREVGDWEELREKLDDISTGYDYYKIDGYGDIIGLDDYDFAEYKDAVLDWGDRNGVWDQDEEEEEIEEDYSGEEEPHYKPSSQVTPDTEAPVEDGCSLNELFLSGFGQLQTIIAEDIVAANEENEAFKQFVSSAV